MGMLGSLKIPTDDRHPSNQQERGQHVDIPLRQRPARKIALEQRSLQRLDVAGVPTFDQHRGNIVNVPPVACVIEIDDGQVFAVVNDVVGRKIGVNQTEIARFFAVGAERGASLVPGM